MSKEKKFFSPAQLMILDGIIIDNKQSDGELEAKPNPFLDEEEEEYVLPDGGIIGVDGGDVIIPDVTGEDGFNADEAYY